MKIISQQISSCFGLVGRILVVVLLLTFAAVTFAQETTGSIEGNVSDATGARISAATLKVVGLAFSRTTTTDAEGVFRILSVPPDVYRVTVSAPGFSTSTIEQVTVALGKATEINISLQVGAMSEGILVSAQDVVRLDPTDNKIQTNVTARQIDDLPKGTSFSSILKLSAATRVEPLSGGFQIDGASGAENSFIIDGLEVSNYLTGVLYSNNNLPFHFVQEVQIKTSGFEAEFGGATGGVINIVTKGGNREFHGEAGYQLEPGSAWAGPRQVLQTFRGAIDKTKPATGLNFTQINNYVRGDANSFMNHYPFGTFSGPIMRKRVWFLGSYAPQIFHSQREAKYLSDDPRTRVVTATQDYKSDVKREYAFARLDAAPWESLRLSGTFLWNPIIQRGIIPASASGNIYLGGAPPSADFGGSTGVLVGSQLTNNQGGRYNSNNETFQAVYSPTSKLVASFRFARGFLNEKLDSYFIPSATRFVCAGLKPPTGAGCSLGFSNISNNFQGSYNVSIRRAFEADAIYLLNGAAGRHEVKGGYQQARISSDVLGGNIPYGTVTLSYGSTINDLTGRNDPITPGSIGAGSLQRSGSQGKAGNIAHVVYFQDKWQPLKRWTINAGLRLEKENLPSYNDFAPPINFGFGDKLAPRLGVAFDVFGNAKTKVFASYGKYLDRLKFNLPLGLFGGSFWRNDYFEISADHPNYDYYTLARILGNNKDVVGGRCPITGSDGLTRCQKDFVIAANDPNAGFENGRVDPNLKPFQLTEFTVGAEQEIFGKWLLSTRYTYKNVNHAIEDSGFPNAQGSIAYIIANTGEGLHAQTAQQLGYAKTTRPQRRYDAFEVKLDRRFATNYLLQANYTYSRLYGNYSGLASSDAGGSAAPNITPYFDLPHVGFTAAGTPDNGRLATDRPHVLKAYGAYDFKWFGKAKKQSSVLSFFTIVQSGTPVTTFYTFYWRAILNGRGDLGRTPTLTETDVNLSHRIRIADKYSLKLVCNVSNVFNEANIINRNNSGAGVNPSIATLGLPVTTEPQAINYILTNGILTNFNAFINNPAEPRYKNTALGMPTGYQSGRAVRFDFRFEF